MDAVDIKAANGILVKTIVNDDPYVILAVVCAIGIITMFTMLKMKDANAADRDYAAKQAE